MIMNNNEFNYDDYNKHNWPYHFLIENGHIKRMAYYPKEKARSSKKDSVESLIETYMTLEKNRNDGNDKNVTKAQNDIISVVEKLDINSAEALRKLQEKKNYVDEHGLILYHLKLIPFV